MAALPAITGLFLYFSLSFGYSLLRDKEIVWPSKYHFKGETLNFKSSLKETFEIWYNGEMNRSRISVFDGSVEKWYYGDKNLYFMTLPMTLTEEMTSEVVCLGRYIYQQVDFLPEASLFEYTGKTTSLYDKEVDIWTASVVYKRYKIRREITLYVYRTDCGIDLPVQRVVKLYHIERGEVMGHEVTNYFDFTDTIAEEELSLEDMDSCMIIGEDKDFKTDMKFFHPEVPIELDMAFESYTNHHSKQYQDEEHQMRKMIFEKNWRMVEEHNRQNLSFRLELNEFSDKTEEELKYLTGTFVSAEQLPDVQEFPYTLEEIDRLAEDLPENFDLRLEGVVSPVKNQGHCGSCWAFTVIAAIEGAFARINGERMLDLSEQSLVDCAWPFHNFGCFGGRLDGALKYVLEYGIPTEMDYGLYEATEEVCYINNMTNLYKIRGFAQVTALSPKALKLALHKFGPVSVAIYASPFMQHYSSGVFYDFNCRYRYPPNHGVTIVGYGVRDGEEYWIVKNSWGEYWGEDGYILMSMRNNNCLVMDTPYYPII